MTKRRRTIAVAFALLASLGIVDRIALYVWASQVIRLFRDLQGIAAREQSQSEDMLIRAESLTFAPKGPDFPIHLLAVTTDRLLAKPSEIMVDGVGGLHLRFLPPIAAWSTWMIPRYDPGHHSDPVGTDPRLHYQYKIDFEPENSGALSITLSRGPYHFSEPLKGDEMRPLFFP